MDSAIAAERERCASIADDLAAAWEKSAEKTRQNGMTRFFFFGPRYVLPMAERDAKTIDAAVHGVRTIARLIREGATKSLWDDAPTGQP